MALDRKGNERIHFSARDIDRAIGVILLRVLAIVQAICLIPILIRFLLLPADFSALGLWFIAIGISLISTPVALWHFIRHPSRRAWAGGMILLAIFTIGTPMVMERLDLEPVSMPIARLIATGLALIVAAWLLARPAWWRAERGWATGRFNTALLTLLLLWIVFIAALWLAGMATGFPPPLASDSRGLELDAILIHGVLFGPLGLLLGVFAFLFSIVGLWRNRQRIVMHIAQLIAALILLALLRTEAFLIILLMVNSG